MRGEYDKLHIPLTTLSGLDDHLQNEDQHFVLSDGKYALEPFIEIWLNNLSESKSITDLQNLSYNFLKDLRDHLSHREPTYIRSYAVNILKNYKLSTVKIYALKEQKEEVLRGAIHPSQTIIGHIYLILSEPQNLQNNIPLIQTYWGLDAIHSGLSGQYKDAHGTTRIGDFFRKIGSFFGAGDGQTTKDRFNSLQQKARSRNIIKGRYIPQTSINTSNPFNYKFGETLFKPTDYSKLLTSEGKLSTFRDENAKIIPQTIPSVSSKNASSSSGWNDVLSSAIKGATDVYAIANQNQNRQPTPITTPTTYTEPLDRDTTVPYYSNEHNQTVPEVVNTSPIIINTPTPVVPVVLVLGSMPLQ